MKDIQLASYNKKRPKIKVGPHLDDFKKVDDRLISFKIDDVTYSFFISAVEKAIKKIKKDSGPGEDSPSDEDDSPTEDDLKDAMFILEEQTKDECECSEKSHNRLQPWAFEIIEAALKELKGYRKK